MLLDYIDNFTFTIIIGIFNIFLIFIFIHLATKLFKDLIETIFKSK